jgi:hypothetical protein
MNIRYCRWSCMLSRSSGCRSWSRGLARSRCGAGSWLGQLIVSGVRRLLKCPAKLAQSGPQRWPYGAHAGGPLAQFAAGREPWTRGKSVKPKREERMAAADRHAARVAGLRRAVFDSPGVSGLAERAAAASVDGVPPPLDAYVAKVDGAAYRITDADVAGGCPESRRTSVAAPLIVRPRSRFHPGRRR